MKEKLELQLKESGERMNTASLNLHQTMKEEWRDVRGYEGLYQVDELISELKEGKTNKELSQKYKCPSNLIAVRRYQFRKRGII